jgi:pyruvate/oxaloacetate carboxyltransferase
LNKRKLQALIGARNLVGYEVYPKDIISKFIKLSVKNGIDIFRVYDALNDIENMKDCISMVLESGADCQGTVVYDPFKEDDTM